MKYMPAVPRIVSQNKILFYLGLILLALWLVPKALTGGEKQNRLLDRQVIAQGSSKQLVVLLHGYGGKEAYLDPLLNTLKAELPDADIFYPSYHTSPFSNSDPEILAGHIENFLDQTYEARKKHGDGGGYENVILVGHSMGGMLARQVYLLGSGQTGADPQGMRRGSKEWAQRVDRIILSASLNRGWSLSPRPRHMGHWKRFSFFMGEKIAGFSGTARLLKSLKRGSPFIANLRVEWMRMSQRPGITIAPTYQLLGDIDDLVTGEDNMDLMCSGNFTFIPVKGSGHFNILRFDETLYGQERKSRFVEVLKGNNEGLAMRYGRNTDGMRAGMHPKSRIVFMMHGIRDHGEWETGLRKELEAWGGDSTEVLSSKYGYFNMIRFILFPFRETNVLWFMDKYTEALARTGNPDVKVGFVGHSNGTFILTKALETYRTLNIDNAVFAGSVVRNSFPWDKYIPSRVASLRNDLGSGDWVVALFPNLYDQICDWSNIEFTWLRDLGSAGFTGFTNNLGNRYEAYYKGNHSTALKIGNHPSIAEFVFTGRVQRDKNLLTDKPSGILLGFSKACSALWLVAVIVTAYVGKKWAVPGLIRLGKRPKTRKIEVTRLSAWSAYLLFILTILYLA